MAATRHATLAERVQHAGVRWMDAVARRTRGSRTVETSRWLLTSSRATLDRSYPRIRGGAEPIAFSAADIEARLRALIRGGTLPFPMPRRMFVGVCLIAHACTASGHDIHSGDREFEWTNAADVLLFFHPGCVEIYRALDGQANAG